MQDVLRLIGVSKTFNLGTLFNHKRINALDKLDLEVRGEGSTVVSIVGESGSGKTTLARVLLGLVIPDAGQVWAAGYKVAGSGEIVRGRDLAGKVQPIFQNPFDGFSAYRRVDSYLRETARNVGGLRLDAEITEAVEEVLNTVGIRVEDVYGKYHTQFSGGELQRISIARALLARPKIIVADEPVSMIDASLRMNVVNLFLKLKDEGQTHFLYITHDLATAYYISDYIAIMYRGCIMEFGPAKEVLERPSNPYTSLLLNSVPTLERKWSDVGEKLPDMDIEDYSRIGCPFSGRCSNATAVCNEERPPATTDSVGRTVYCHHALGSEISRVSFSGSRAGSDTEKVVGKPFAAPDNKGEEETDNDTPGNSGHE